jgi:hypothetical protein
MGGPFGARPSCAADSGGHTVTAEIVVGETVRERRGAAILNKKKAGARPADSWVFVRRRLGLRTSNHRIYESLITFGTNDDHLPLPVC